MGDGESLGGGGGTERPGLDSSRNGIYKEDLDILRSLKSTDARKSNMKSLGGQMGKVRAF